VAEVTAHFDKYELGIALEKLSAFLWDDFCDWYIELIKPRLNGEDEAAKRSARQVMVTVLTTTLKLLHPFVPFITEALWQALLPYTAADSVLMVAPWPVADDLPDRPADEAEMARLIELIRAIRARRAELGVPPGRRCKVTIVTALLEVFERGRPYLLKLGYASELAITAEMPDIAGLVQVVTADARALLPLSELLDVAAERARLGKAVAAAEAELGKLTAKLGNPGFTDKAPAAVVAGEREKAAALESKLAGLRESLSALG